MLPTGRFLLLPEARRPDWVRRSPSAPWFAVGAVCLGAFMGQLDASIVSLAFPSMSHDLRAGLAAVQWVSLAYLAVLAVLLVPVGRLADARGRKRMYLNGFLLFTLASAACALAPSLGWLIGFRALQAVGAALLQANSVALVVGSAPPDRTRSALGFQAAAQALGLALGPVLGGVLVGSFGWRSVFWVNVPVGLIAVAAGQVLLPRSRQLRAAGRPDRRGGLLFALGLLGLLGTLTALSGARLPAATWGVTLTALLIGWIGLLIVEPRTPEPFIDVRALGLSASGAPLLGALLGYLALFAPLVLYPTVFGVWALGPERGGLFLGALPLGFAAAAMLASRLRHDATNAARIRLGGALLAVAWTGQVIWWERPGIVAALLLLAGIGLGVAVPANNAIIMAGAAATAAAATGGLINVARAVGTSLGVAGTVLVVHLAAGGTVSAAPIVLAGLAVAGVGLALTALWDHAAAPAGWAPE